MRSKEEILAQIDAIKRQLQKHGKAIMGTKAETKLVDYLIALYWVLGDEAPDSVRNVIPKRLVLSDQEIQFLSSFW
jgi:hypothetical protein